MIVLKDKVCRTVEMPKPVKVTISTKGMFDDPKVRSYRNFDEETAYTIATEVVYRRVKSIERIKW